MADTVEKQASQSYGGGNLWLDSLPAAERKLVVAHLDVIELSVPSCVLMRGEEIEHVLFPIDAVFSITADLKRGDAYEVAAAGRQGIIGAEVVAGITAAPRSVMVQVSGRAAQIERDVFLGCVDESRRLSGALQRYLLNRLYMAEQFVACNFAHDTTQRCARWILMLIDEVGREAFNLRAEFLGMMLGLPAPAVLEAAAPLNRVRAVRYKNEELQVLDRNKLLPVACECYEEQRRFIAQPV